MIVCRTFLGNGNIRRQGPWDRRARWLTEYLAHLRVRLICGLMMHQAAAASKPQPTLRFTTCTCSAAAGRSTVERLTFRAVTRTSASDQTWQAFAIAGCFDFGKRD